MKNVAITASQVEKAVRRDGVGQYAVHHIAALDADHRENIHHLIHGLGKGGALPTQLAEEDIHQITGRHAGALPRHVVADNGLGRIVGPDQVAGAVVGEKALLRTEIQIHAHLLIEDLVVPHPGQMIAKGHQHHRLLILPQAVHQFGQLLVGLPNHVQVVGDGLPALQAVVPRQQLLHPHVPGGVGAVALHVDGEGEIGSAGGLVLLKIAVDCGQKIGVLGVDGVRHVLKVALHEAVALQAHVGVDILPVVKPLVIGVAALRRVALAAQVPGVGVDVMAEVVEAVVAREKAPLRVNGAAGEDVGHQIAGIALRLQLVIELVAAGVQPWDVVSGEISVGLPHDGDAHRSGCRSHGPAPPPAPQRRDIWPR